MFGSAHRPHRVLELLGGLDAETIWRLIHAKWCSFDAIPHKEFAKVFRRNRRQWSAEFLGDKDRTFYDALPESFRAYRGQDGDHLVGLSWTLDKNVAASFARGHRGLFNPSPRVLEAVIAKRDIAGAYTEREEREIVVFKPPRSYP